MKQFPSTGYTCPGGSLKLICLVLFIVLTGPTSVWAQKEFDGIRGTHNWIGFSDAPNALYHHLAGQASQYLDKRAHNVAAIQSLPEWQQRQKWIRTTLAKAVGAFPAKTPLNARVVRTIEKDGYRVENIIYESQPGYAVTASLFIPDKFKNGNRGPAIIFCSGHSNNGYRAYQNTLLNLVKKGFIVFAFDPIGQGERLQYYNPQTNKSVFKWPAFEHSYVGAQVFLTGNTLACNFIWDGIRATDYLLTRKEVDAERIGITGRSGGGTQSAFIAAFDERIKAAAPENYITNFKRLYQSMGPQDAEQDFFAGIQKGLDMADLLAVRAPKPVLVIATTQDMFPIQGVIETAKEVSRLYKAYGKPANFAVATDDAPHASTKKNREAMYAFFQRVLENPGDPQDEKFEPLSAEELQVAETGQVSTALKSESAYSLNYKDAEKRMHRLAIARKDMPGYFSGVVRSAKVLSGYLEPKETGEPVFAGRIQREGYVVEKYLLKGEGNYIIPYLLLKPETPTHKALVYLHPSGKSADAGVGGEMEWFVKNGVTVLAPDMLGTGEMGPGEFKGDSYIDSVSYNLWFAALLTGRSIVGIQAGDVVRLISQLSKDGGFREVYGLAKKQMAPVLLHAAAFDRTISKVALVEPYSSYRSVAMNPQYNPDFLHSTVAGSIGVYDLPDLAALLAPKKLLLIGVTDGNGSNSQTADIGKDLPVIKAAYQLRAPEQLQIVPATTAESAQAYFRTWIGE
jgi:cephalosporin-C deacetylase-like acetyl esterase